MNAALAWPVVICNCIRSLVDKDALLTPNLDGPRHHSRVAIAVVEFTACPRLKFVRIFIVALVLNALDVLNGKISGVAQARVSKACNFLAP